MLLEGNILGILNREPFKIGLLHSFFKWNNVTNTWAFSKNPNDTHEYTYVNGTFRTTIGNKLYYWDMDKTNLILTDKQPQTKWDIIMDYYNVTLKYDNYTLTQNLITTPLNSKMAVNFYFYNASNICISLDFLINQMLIGYRSVWQWMIHKDKHTKRVMDDGQTVAINKIYTADNSTLINITDQTIVEIIIELLYENGVFYFETRMPNLVDSLVAYSEYDGLSLVTKTSLVLTKDPLCFHWVNGKYLFTVPKQLTFDDITIDPMQLDRSTTVFLTRNNKKLQINPLASNYTVTTEMVDYYLNLPPNILIENKQYHSDDMFNITLIDNQNNRSTFTPISFIPKPIYAPYTKQTLDQAFGQFVESNDVFTWENVKKYKFYILILLMFLLFF